MANEVDAPGVFKQRLVRTFPGAFDSLSVQYL